MRYRRFVAVRGKNEAANIGSSETGHPNMSCWQTSYRDMLARYFMASSQLQSLDTVPLKGSKVDGIMK
jgi:hypothetical protein